MWHKIKYQIQIQSKIIMKERINSISKYFQITGKSYWTASLLPAIVGTTLPFWLYPLDFEFKFAKAILFLIATLLGQVGFTFLYFGFTQKFNSEIKRKPLFILGIISLLITILIGLYINNTLHFHNNVPDYIFIVYGITSIFVGVLYVVPPFSFHQRLYGEVVVSVGLGMLPVLGAYLVQVGDITRTVYLASLPVVVSTGLWLWIKELINKGDDKKLGYKTTVMYFTNKVSSRYLTTLLIILIYTSLVLAVVGRSSINPLSLIALFSFIFALMIIRIIWKDYENIRALQSAAKYAFFIHLSICVFIILSSVSSIYLSFE